MAESVLSDFKAPTINDIAAMRVLSNTVFKNIFQGIIERDERGVTQRFSDDVSGAQIRIIKVNPVKQFARRLGAAVNGGNFPISAYEGSTDSFGLDVLDVLDTPFDLANVTREMIPVDLLSAYVESYTGRVNRAINGMTLAGKFYATALKDAKGEEVNITEFDDDGNFRTAIVNANSLLDEGIEEMDVDAFPMEGRCFTIQAKYRPTLLDQGVLILGGANLGYEIIESGTVSAGAVPTKLENGYIGIVDGVPCHTVSSVVYKEASKYLGLPKGDVENAIGCISSHLANVRGIAAPNQIKIIDSPMGQGLRVQPLTRLGFTVLPGYEKGNSFIMKKGFVSPYESLKTLFGLSDYSMFSVVPEGSRIELGTTATATTGSVTVTSPKAVKIAVVLDADDKVKGVSDFATLFAATSATTAKSNTVTSGTAVSLSSVKSGNIVKVLALAADGTCELISVKAA